MEHFNQEYMAYKANDPIYQWIIKYSDRVIKILATARNSSEFLCSTKAHLHFATFYWIPPHLFDRCGHKESLENFVCTVVRAGWDLCGLVNVSFILASWQAISCNTLTFSERAGCLPNSEVVLDHWNTIITWPIAMWSQSRKETYVARLIIHCQKLTYLYPLYHTLILACLAYACDGCSPHGNPVHDHDFVVLCMCNALLIQPCAASNDTVLYSW